MLPKTQMTSGFKSPYFFVILILLGFTASCGESSFDVRPCEGEACADAVPEKPADDIPPDDKTPSEEEPPKKDPPKKDPPEDEPPKKDVSCDPSVRQGSKVYGRLWVDKEGVGLTEYRQGLDPTSPSVPGLADVAVRLHLAGGVVLETQSCEDGWYSFPNEKFPEMKFATQGFIEFGRTDCTTNNCPANFAKKVGKGDGPINMLTWGDSIASFPIKSGANPPIWFPERFQKLVSPIATVENVNKAIPGTRTFDWMPGTKHYRERIEPNLSAADVMVITIGGNDVLYDFLLGGPIFFPNILADNIPKNVEKAMENLTVIIDTIQAARPDLDILIINYLRYSRTFKTVQGIAQPAVRQKVRDAMDKALNDHTVKAASFDRVYIVDVYGKTEMLGSDGQPYDNESLLVSDGIHLNPKGHTFHSRQLFTLLGGWMEEDSPEEALEDTSFGKVRFVGYPETP